MSTENMIDRLNALLRGELSAVETYDLALKKIKHVEFGGTLRQLRDDHDQRVTVLRDKIRELAGEPSQSSGVWGAFAKAVQTGADLLGDTSAVAALEEGEDHGIKMYKDALGDAEPVVRDLVGTVLMPAQKKSHDLCRSLKRFVNAA